MSNTIADELARIGAPGSFATRRSAPPRDLKLEVDGVGRIRLPVPATTARRLCEVARPARHGYKEQTRLDTAVRDTWEIPAKRITIDERAWRRTLEPQLEGIRRDLGLPEGCRLRAEPHNLLVYAPGQFFVTHQDSEKSDAMIGTLVVTLPSRFRGGAMIIGHHDAQLLARGSATQLGLVAFYADCRHEVRPVTQGYRVVLTYNLLVRDGIPMAPAPEGGVEALRRSIRKFFDAPRAPSFVGDTVKEPPDRLVYLLDHEYTPRSLAWDSLKNADAPRAAALREVAQQLDCEIYLALADVHETWDCEPDESYGYGRRRSRRDWGFDDEEEEEEEEEEFEGAGHDHTPALLDLVDSDIELRHWIDAGGRRRSMSAGVGGHELCFTRPSIELDPFDSRYEGYMGNWGNTVERWYHRAAVVMWPRERNFVIRARAAPRWAIGEVAKALKKSDTAPGRALAQRLVPLWSRAVAQRGPWSTMEEGALAARRKEKAALFEATIAVAVRLDEPALASALLEPFGVSALDARRAPRFGALLDRYGAQWCRTLWQQWASEQRHAPAAERLAWIGAALPALCRTLGDGKRPGAPAFARWVLAEQWTWLLAHAHQLRKSARRADLEPALRELCRPLLGLLAASRTVQDDALHARVIAHLGAADSGYPVSVPLALLQAAHARYEGDALRRLGLKPLHAACAQDLQTRLDAPPRAPEDWSIATPLGCACALCTTLTRFLRSPEQKSLDWPLAQNYRAHVHDKIEFHALPVSHTTRRSGRPYTLELRKTPILFERDAAERRSWEQGLEWITRAGGDF